MVTCLTSALPNKGQESLGTDKSVTVSSRGLKNLKIQFRTLETNISYLPHGKSFKRAYYLLYQNDPIRSLFTSRLRSRISALEAQKKSKINKLLREIQLASFSLIYISSTHRWQQSYWLYRVEQQTLQVPWCSFLPSSFLK
jgi:hypothetical protein